MRQFMEMKQWTTYREYFHITYNLVEFYFNYANQKLTSYANYPPIQIVRNLDKSPRLQFLSL